MCKQSSYPLSKGLLYSSQVFHRDINSQAASTEELISPPIPKVIGNIHSRRGPLSPAHSSNR